MESASPVVPAIRSTHGCWTCRLRKKKCDELRPECSRCASVNIICHYGDKPDWISNASRGKEQLEHVKLQVGASAKRKRAAYRARIKSSDSPSTPSNEPPDIISYDPSHQNTQRDGSEQYLPSSEDKVNHSSRVEEGLLFSKDHETNLMMHYLDHVFFIQFRFYSPSVSSGGRGWLLSLLLRTKPLYHAALSLSAFHQQSLLSVDQDVIPTQKSYLQELERHHNLTLEELQLFILAQKQPNSMTGNLSSHVQILACMVQLISFELFNGGDSNWQVHLTAASILILSIHGLSNGISALNEESLVPSQSYVTRSATSLVSPDMAALDFFTSAIIWFDILSCISTGSPPHLAAHHDQFLTSTQNIFTTNPEIVTKLNLHDIMGCQNWVMKIIGEIAQLSSLSGVRTPFDFSDIQRLADVAKDIQNRLEAGKSRVHAELDALRREYSGHPPPYYPEVYGKYTVLVVTYTFACAAVIYLQTSITSSPSIFHIRDPLQDVMAAMRMIPDPRMVRGLVWPLCVAGCVASTTSEQDFFRRTAGAAITDARTFGNSCKALNILEMAWKVQREEGRLMECASCIQRLGTCVLLA